MNKLLTLINLELKRNSRFYVIYLGLFSFLTLSLNVFQIFKFKKSNLISDSIKDYFGGLTYGNSIIYNNNYLYLIIGFGLVGLVFYTIYMWKRDYIDANRSIYTLIMIPQNKFNIYLSKMIATITVIYSFLLSQIFMIFISKTIFNLVFKNIGLIKTSLSNDLSYSEIAMKFIPIEIIDFLMNYGLILVFILSIIFTACLIGLSYKESPNGIIIAILIMILLYCIIALIFPNGIYTFIKNMGVISNIEANIIIISVYIIILNAISYVLINKKIYI